MKFTVFVGTFNAFGGGELLALATIKTLKKAFPTHEIELLTIDIPDVKSLAKIFGYEFVLSLHGCSWKPLGIIPANSIWKSIPYVRLAHLTIRSLSRNINSVFINLNAESYPIPATVCYVHFPYFGVEKKGFSLRAKLRKKVSLEAIKRCRVVLVNSKFTKKVLDYLCPHISSKTEILYPPLMLNPIDETLFLKTLPQRKPQVLTISRFHPEKKLDFVFEVAKELPNVEFIIVGSMHSYNYFKQLVEKTREVPNVRLIPNVSREQLIEIMKYSKAYLHTMPYEHFGISIVEAMSQGLVPIVHKSGGQWEDILEEKDGLYGYSYRNVSEAVQAIKLVVHDNKHYSDLALNVIKRSTLFTFQRFSENLIKIITEYRM